MKMKMPPLRPLLKAAAPWVITALAMMAVAGIDLTSRSRAAYRWAEHLETLARHPAEREKAVEALFLSGVESLDHRRLSPAEREIEMEILRKKWEEARLRSPWTDAYYAWKDVFELTAPPETSRTRIARLSAAAARQRWREEWTARKLPFDPVLLGLEPGETDGFRLIYSTTDGREASMVLSLFDTLEVPCRMIPPATPTPPGDDGIRLLVVEDRFWEAHRALAPLVGVDENL